jgi:hypothetical protein
MPGGLDTMFKMASVGRPESNSVQKGLSMRFEVLAQLI